MRPRTSATTDGLIRSSLVELKPCIDHIQSSPSLAPEVPEGSRSPPCGAEDEH